MAHGGPRSSATLLALVYGVLVLYASLYPFEGWRWPPGQALTVLMGLPTAQHQSVFDIGSNLLGYLPLGGLITVAALRSGWTARPAVALALLVLWPVALLFPTPVALGLGQVGERMREWLVLALDGVPWATTAYELVSAGAPPEEPLRPLSEALIVALGLMAPSLLAFSVVAPGWRRTVMALGALVLATAAMTLSTVLNFGPQHAWAWLGPRTVPGLALGTVAALLMAPLARRVIAGVGLAVLTGLVVGVAQAPDDPYFAQSLLAWEQGRFVRFHGLAQWIGWLWPYAAMGWMLSRLGGRN